MNAATPNARTAPIAGVKISAGEIGCAVNDSAGLANAATSNTITTTNSSATSTPSTFAERSMRFTPIHPTIAMNTITMSHHGISMPNIELRKSATWNPSIP